MYRSDTPQAFNANHYTFTSLHVDRAGTCYATEMRGGRDIKPKGLVVRYPNPFASDAPAEQLHATSEALSAIWQTPAGVVHAFGKQHYTNASGTWKKTKGFDSKYAVNYAWGSGDVLYAGCAYPGTLYRMTSAGTEQVDIGHAGEDMYGLDGTALDDVYVSTREHLVHFDGTAWHDLAGAPAGGDLAFDGGTLLVTGGGTAVYRRDGSTFVAVCEGAPEDRAIVAAVGGVYLTDGRSVSRVEGSALVEVMEATGYISKSIAGNPGVLWCANGIELLCFDGTTWKQVRRIHDETTKRR